MILAILPERQKANGAPPGDLKADSKHFGEPILLQRHLCWQASFWSPLSVLLGLKAYLPTAGPTQSQDTQDVRQPSMDLASSIGEPAPDLALLAAKASCTRTGPADQKGQQTLHKTGHGSKWGQGLALPISIPTIVNPTRATEPTQGTLVWWLEGSVLLGLRGCLLHRVTFPRLQNTTKLIMDTNKRKELGKMSWQKNVSQTKA